MIAWCAFIGIPCLFGVATTVSHLPHGLDDSDVFALWIPASGLVVTVPAGLLARNAPRRVEQRTR